MNRWGDFARTFWWLLVATAFAVWFVSLAVRPDWGGPVELVSLALLALMAFWLVAGGVLRAPAVRRRLRLPERRH